MQLEFQDNYLLGVLLVLWVLCSCRSLLESCATCVRLVHRGADLCGVAPCPLGCSGGEGLRQAVVLFCFLQPAVFCGMYLLHRSGPGDRQSSTILHNAVLNSSSLAYAHGNASVWEHDRDNRDAVVLLIAANTVQIDYLLVVLPFSVLVSGTSLLWVHCINVRALSADTKWDSDMPDAVFVYEMVYYCEVWLMNVSCIAVMCSERSLLEVHYAAMTLTLMLVYALAQARVCTEYSAAGHVISVTVVLAFLAVLLPMWTLMLQTACPVAVGVALVHAGVVLTLAVFHSLACGEAAAGMVLLVRVACTMLVCATHTVVYAVGRNRLCG